jgi:hypothetical protein
MAVPKPPWKTENLSLVSSPVRATLLMDDATQDRPAGNALEKGLKRL